MSKKNRDRNKSEEERNNLSTPFEGSEETKEDGREDWKDPYLSAEVVRETPKGAEGTSPEDEEKYTRKRYFSKYDEQHTVGAEEGEESKEEKERSEKGERGSFEAAGRKAMKFIEEKTANLDKRQIAKYAAAGALVLIGLRKSGFLRGLAVTAAASLLAKYLAENSSELLGETQGGEEGEQEESFEGAAEKATMGTL